jgi:thioredoxin-like negative regulator of GroEL
MQAAHGFGAQKAVADSLVELSEDPAVAGLAFRLARECFALAGDHARLGTAFQRARQAAPKHRSVRGCSRYRALLEDPDGTPDLPAAEADVAAAPADPFVRITAALAYTNYQKVLNVWQGG